MRRFGGSRWIKGAGWVLGAIVAAAISVPVVALLSGDPIPHKGLERALGSSVPLWLCLAGLLVIAVCAVAAVLLQRRRTQAAAGDADAAQELLARARLELRGLKRERDEIATRLANDAVCAKVLADVLAHVEEALSSALRDTTVERLIEKGVLEPMAGVLSQQRGDTVRVGVLQVVPDEPFHYMISQQANWGGSADAFRWSQADPLENLGFQTGEIVVSHRIMRNREVSAMLVTLAPSDLTSEHRAFMSMVAGIVGVIHATQGAQS